MSLMIKLSSFCCLFYMFNFTGSISFNQLKDIEKASNCNDIVGLSQIFAYYIFNYNDNEKVYLSYDKTNEIKKRLYYNEYFNNTSRFYDLVFNSSYLTINSKQDIECNALQFSLGIKKIRNISDLNLDYEISNPLNSSNHKQLEPGFLYLVKVQLYSNLKSPSENYTIQTYLVDNEDKYLSTIEKSTHPIFMVKVDQVGPNKVTILKINSERDHFYNQVYEIVLTNMGSILILEINSFKKSHNFF